MPFKKNIKLFKYGYTTKKYGDISFGKYNHKYKDKIKRGIPINIDWEYLEYLEEDMKEFQIINRRIYDTMVKAEGFRRLGGSAAGTILGCSPWKEPFELWFDRKVKRQVVPMNHAMEMGLKLEPILIEKFRSLHPELKQFTGWQSQDLVINEKIPMAVGAIDWLGQDQDGSPVPVEIKTCSSFDKADWDGGVPAHYLAQVLMYCALTGARKAYIYCGFDYNEELGMFGEISEYEISPETMDFDSSIGALLHQMKKFDERYLTGNDIPTPISEEDWELFQSPEVKEYLSLDDMPLNTLCVAHSELTHRRKEIDKALKGINALIKVNVPKGEKIETGNGFKLNHYQINRKSFSSTELKKKDPETYAKYVKESISFALKVTAPKK